MGTRKSSRKPRGLSCPSDGEWSRVGGAAFWWSGLIRLRESTRRRWCCDDGGNRRLLVLAGSLRLLFTGWQILRQFPVEAALVALFSKQGGRRVIEARRRDLGVSHSVRCRGRGLVALVGGDCRAVERWMAWRGERAVWIGSRLTSISDLEVFGGY